MKNILKILSILILIALITGGYFKLTDESMLGDRIIGIAVLAATFILLPIWLYYSWRGKRLQDYTLTDENIRKMKEKNEQRKRGNKF